MKRNEVFKLIFVNPFERIAGWQAFGVGLIFMILTALVGSYNGAYFDGALDMHVNGKPYSFWIAIAMLNIDLVSIIIMFLLAGLIFSKNFRVIDIIGTTYLAKAPTLFLALTTFFPQPEFINMISENPEVFISNPNIIFSSIAFFAIIILSIPILIWTIILFYNAFKVSLNIRKNNSVIFIFVIVLAEIISKIFINILF